MVVPAALRVVRLKPGRKVKSSLIQQSWRNIFIFNLINTVFVTINAVKKLKTIFM